MYVPSREASSFQVGCRSDFLHLTHQSRSMAVLWNSCPLRKKGALFLSILTGAVTSGVISSLISSHRIFPKPVHSSQDPTFLNKCYLGLWVPGVFWLNIFKLPKIFNKSSKFTFPVGASSYSLYKTFASNSSL